MWRIGIDVGGTFTDLVAIDDRGAATLAKVPSTPVDPSRGVLDGLARLAEALGISPAALLGGTDRIVHGTTVATNALLEGKGARTGMLVTAGHRDVIEMREGLKPDRYDMRVPPPPALVPRALRLPVRERMRHDGRVETPLDQQSLDRRLQRSAPPTSRQSPSASCTPGATLATRRSRPPPCGGRCPKPTCRCRRRCCRRSRSSSASRPPWSMPMWARCWPAISRASATG